MIDFLVTFCHVGPKTFTWCFFDGLIVVVGHFWPYSKALLREFIEKYLPPCWKAKPRFLRLLKNIYLKKKKKHFPVVLRLRILLGTGSKSKAVCEG